MTRPTAFPTLLRGDRITARMGFRPGTNPTRAVPLLVFLAGLVATPALAKKGAPLDIRPGPAAITAEERAIEPDPSSGVEHAVVLVEETERNDNLVGESETSYHLRAKILSNEGRDLADVEIPFVRHEGKLREWWARTIQPDGRVLELTQEQLEEQPLIKASGIEIGALKGALPGVIPGCIIDYGYVLRSRLAVGDVRIPLQKPWPVRLFRYRWVPSGFFMGAYSITRQEGHDIHATKDSSFSITIVARNLSPLTFEPWMPPEQEVGASVALYYLEREAEPKDYWNTEAKRLEWRLRWILRKDRPLQAAITAMKLPPEADLRTKLQAMYDWLAANIQCTDLLSAEEAEAAGEEDDENREAMITQVLDQKRGTARQLDYLFIGLARLLGAEARLVLATDRTQHYWDPAILSLDQFDTSFAAVRGPGEPDEKTALVDPGSGLPFGEVPWWAAGAKALVVSEGGARSIRVPASGPHRNVSETTVSVGFSEDGESFHAEWTRTGRGAQGFTERRHLRSLSPGDRVKRLDELCGAEGQTEVLDASAPGLEEPAGPFKLTCRTETSITEIGPEIGRYSMSFDGPWLVAPPELPEGPRVHPVIFRYPETDILSVGITAPSGFSPAEAPAPVNHETPYGSYRLTFTPMDEGFRLTRSLVLRRFEVPPTEYESLRRFLSEVRSADRALVVFLRGKPAQ